MAPFWTSWPIQSCAPTSTSGPLPAWLAVMNAARVSVTAWTPTVMLFALAYVSATACIAARWVSSVQMTRSSSPRTGAASVADSDGLAESVAVSVLLSAGVVVPDEHAASSRLAPTATASPRGILRMGFLHHRSVAPSGVHRREEPWRRRQWCEGSKPLHFLQELSLSRFGHYYHVP